MIAVAPTNTNIDNVRVLWAMPVALALALAAALAYALVGLNVLPVGDLQATEAPAAISFVCAGSYLLGGLLILLRRRGLWLVGHSTLS